MFLINPYEGNNYCRVPYWFLFFLLFIKLTFKGSSNHGSGMICTEIIFTQSQRNQNEGNVFRLPIPSVSVLSIPFCFPKYVFTNIFMTFIDMSIEISVDFTGKYVETRTNNSKLAGTVSILLGYTNQHFVVLVVSKW